MRVLDARPDRRSRSALATRSERIDHRRPLRRTARPAARPAGRAGGRGRDAEACDRRHGAPLGRADVHRVAAPRRGPERARRRRQAGRTRSTRVPLARRSPAPPRRRRACPEGVRTRHSARRAGSGDTPVARARPRLPPASDERGRHRGGRRSGPLARGGTAAARLGRSYGRRASALVQRAATPTRARRIARPEGCGHGGR